jgi:hypothetical protein
MRKLGPIIHRQAHENNSHTTPFYKITIHVTSSLSIEISGISTTLLHRLVRIQY